MTSPVDRGDLRTTMVKETGEVKILCDSWAHTEPMGQLRPVICDSGWWEYTDLVTEGGEDIHIPGPESESEDEEREDEGPIQTAEGIIVNL